MVPSWLTLSAAAAGLWLALGEDARAATSTCVYQHGETQSYLLLGSLVEPSSNIIIVGACGSSFEQLNAQYVQQAPDRGSAPGSGECKRRTNTNRVVSCAAPRID